MPFKVHFTPDEESLGLLADSKVIFKSPSRGTVSETRGTVEPYTATWPDDFDTWEDAEEAIKTRGMGKRHEYSITYVGPLDDLGEFQLEER